MRPRPNDGEIAAREAQRMESYQASLKEISWVHREVIAGKCAEIAERMNAPDVAEEIRKYGDSGSSVVTSTHQPGGAK